MSLDVRQILSKFFNGLSGESGPLNTTIAGETYSIGELDSEILSGAGLAHIVIINHDISGNALEYAIWETPLDDPLWGEGGGDWHPTDEFADANGEEVRKTLAGDTITWEQFPAYSNKYRVIVYQPDGGTSVSAEVQWVFKG